MPDPTPLAAAASRAGLSVPEVAARVGVSAETVKWWSLGYTPIAEARRPALADALGVTVADVEGMSRPCAPVAARRVAREQGLTVAELARRMNLQTREVHACLAGRLRIRPAVSAALEEALGMPAEYLTAPDGGDR